MSFLFPLLEVMLWVAMYGGVVMAASASAAVEEAESNKWGDSGRSPVMQVSHARAAFRPRLQPTSLGRCP